MPIFRLVPRRSPGTDREKARLLRPYRQFITRLKRAKTKLGQVALRRGERLAQVRALLREAAREAGVTTRLSRDGKAVTVTLRARPGRRRRRRKAPAPAQAQGRRPRRRARRRRPGPAPGPAARKGVRKAKEAAQAP